MPSDATDFLPTRRSLLNRLKNADDHAGWQEFLDTYGQLIYGVARKTGLTDAEAQDAMQETVIAVSRHIGEFQYDPARCSFKTWLMLLTRQRISREFAKRSEMSSYHPAGVGDSAGETPAARSSHDATRTATIERVPDPAGPDLEVVWDDEWKNHLLTVAMERVKRQVKAEHFQMFDLSALQHWPVRDVARSLGVSVGQVYLVRHRIGRLLRTELRRLEKQRA